MKRAAKAAYHTLIAAAACALIIGLARCRSTAIPEDPTPDKPWVRCLARSPFPSMQQKTASGGRLLPRTVYIIGFTSFEDGHRLMGVVGVYTAANCRGDLVRDRSKCDWLPFDEREVQKTGCGPETQAHMDLAARREP